MKREDEKVGVWDYIVYIAMLAPILFWLIAGMGYAMTR